MNLSYGFRWGKHAKEHGQRVKALALKDGTHYYNAVENNHDIVRSN